MVAQASSFCVCSYHVTWEFLSESTLYSFLNVKELLAQSRREIWSLSDCNWTRTHNHLFHKRTLHHFAKLVFSFVWGSFIYLFIFLARIFKKVLLSFYGQESSISWNIRIFFGAAFLIYFELGLKSYIFSRIRSFLEFLFPEK